MYRLNKIYNFLFLKIVLYFLIDKMGVIVQVYYFVVAKYKKDTIFINVNNLVCRVFQVTFGLNKSYKVVNH